MAPQDPRMSRRQLARRKGEAHHFLPIGLNTSHVRDMLGDGGSSALTLLLGTISLEDILQCHRVRFPTPHTLPLHASELLHNIMIWKPYSEKKF